MDFKVSSKIGFELETVIHIGAHKFEELEDYVRIGTKDVLWVDPINTFLPGALPQGHQFEQFFVTENHQSHSTLNIYEATGFSSSKQLINPGSIVLGTPSEFVKSEVPNISGRELVKLLGTRKTEGISLCIDVQGSEFEVLKSFDLGAISEIIVETSKSPLYSDSKSTRQIIELLDKHGFFHNFNGSDFFIGHGDQYFSRIDTSQKFFELTYRLRQSARFVFSIFSRAAVALKLRMA